MHTQEKKDKFWKEHSRVSRIRNIYRVLGYFVYPFIQRTKVREKVYKGNVSWYTKQLWYMLNDDEISRYGVDYDVKMVEERGIPKWIASYWFNALRNSGYNWLMSNPPYDKSIDSYTNKEYTIDNIVQGIGDEEERVNPLNRAEWVKEGKKIDWEYSKRGEGEVWYHPNGDKSVSLCRYSKAYIKKFLFWDLYITIKKGEMNGGRKYDSHYKLAKVKRR